MNNDHDTRTDDSSFVIGQALSGRHLLDSPLETSSYQGASHFNGAGDTRLHRPPPAAAPSPATDGPSRHVGTFRDT